MIVNDFEIQQCASCGCYFGVPSGFTANRRSDKGSFYCPNGHSMSYNESELDRVRRERDRLKQGAAEKDDEIKRQRELRKETERKLVAAKGQMTKLRKRVSNGVCPCCNRTFADMARHMQTKHPEFIVDDGSRDIATEIIQ